MAVSNHYSDYTSSHCAAHTPQWGPGTGSSGQEAARGGVWTLGWRGQLPTEACWGKVVGKLYAQIWLTPAFCHPLFGQTLPCSSALFLSPLEEQKRFWGKMKSRGSTWTPPSASPSRFCAQSPTHWLHPQSPWKVASRSADLCGLGAPGTDPFSVGGLSLKCISHEEVKPGQPPFTFQLSYMIILGCRADVMAAEAGRAPAAHRVFF